MSIITLPEAKKTTAILADRLASARRVLELEAFAIQEMSKGLDDSFQQALDIIADTTGRVIVTGMGKSGHIARKIAATFSSTGTPSFFVHPAEASHGDMGMIMGGDAVIAISNSGEAKELLDLIEYTRRFAIPLIAITSRMDSTLSKKSDVTLLLPPVPEACPNGLAPTTSTTLTLALGDALAVTLLEAKGFSATDFRVFHPGGKLGQQLMNVSEIMATGDKLPLAAETVSVQDAVKVISDKSYGCVALTKTDGTLAGMITDGDIRRHLGNDIMGKTAADIMTKTPKTAAPDMLVAEAMAIMNDMKNAYRKITVLIVVDAENKPVGLLHLHDCLRAGFA